MRALICGVSGQDGAYLAKLLLEKGYAVLGTSRNVATASFANLEQLGIRDEVELHSLDLTEPHGAERILEATAPDEIYNLSGQSSVGLSFEQPLETFASIATATLHLLDALRRLNGQARFCNAGSGECFGETCGHAADEQTRFEPRSPYAVAKASAHWLVAYHRETFGLHASTAILFNHESPLRPPRFVTRKVTTAAVAIARGSQSRLMLGALHLKRDWGWAPEYVDAMWRIVQRDEPGDYVIATGESHSLEEFVAVAFNHVGLDWRRHVELSDDLIRRNDIAELRGSAAKARAVLGWSAGVTMREVVVKMVDAELARELGLKRT